MNRGGSTLLPMVLILAGYFAADALLEGITAALAVTGLGVAEYLILLVSRGKNSPGLLVEAALLGGAVLAGDALSASGYPGAGYAVLELLLGAVLTFTALSGKPWLPSRMKGFMGFSPAAGFLREISIVMGSMFLVHGTIMAWGAFLHGGISVALALGSFAALYVAAVLVLRRRRRSDPAYAGGALRRTAEGSFELLHDGVVLGTFAIQPGSVVEIRDLEMTHGSDPELLIRLLEKGLAASGASVVRFRDWEGDTLPLEISGYTSGPFGWTRIIGSVKRA